MARVLGDWADAKTWAQTPSVNGPLGNGRRVHEWVLAVVSVALQRRMSEGAKISEVWTYLVRVLRVRLPMPRHRPAELQIGDILVLWSSEKKIVWGTDSVAWEGYRSMRQQQMPN